MTRNFFVLDAIDALSRTYQDGAPLLIGVRMCESDCGTASNSSCVSATTLEARKKANMQKVRTEFRASSCRRLTCRWCERSFLGGPHCALLLGNRPDRALPTGVGPTSNDNQTLRRRHILRNKQRFARMCFGIPLPISAVRTFYLYKGNQNGHATVKFFRKGERSSN